MENIGRLFTAAKDRGFEVFISPHYLYPADQAWRFGGAVEQMMLEDKEFFRPDPLSVAGFTGSGADWLDRYKPFIEDGKTVVVSAHKVWGPQTNDLVLQLRKRHINKVVLAGMLANLCVESHLRELIEQGFEVAVVKDATAGPRHPKLGDGYPGRGRQLSLHRQCGAHDRRGGNRDASIGPRSLPRTQRRDRFELDSGASPTGPRLRRRDSRSRNR